MPGVRRVTVTVRAVGGRVTTPEARSTVPALVRMMSPANAGSSNSTFAVRGRPVSVSVT